MQPLSNARGIYRGSDEVRSGLRPQIAWAVYGWTIAVAILLFGMFHAHGFDDPFITYRYTLNLARGYGFVYNQGEHVLSTTTPFYALLLVPAVWLGLSVPLVSNAIACAALALGGLAFWQLGRLWGTPIAGLVGLVLYPLFPLLIQPMGAETALYCALLLWSCVWYARQRLTIVAVLLALTTWTRFDGLLLGPVLLVHHLLIQRRPIPWRAGFIYLLVILPWLAWAWWYFGAPLPVTLVAKQRQAQLANSQTFFAGFAGWVQQNLLHPLYSLHWLLAAGGMMYALGKRQPWLMVVGWSLIYFLAYTVLGVSKYFWYYAPLVVGFVTLVALGAEGLSRLIRSRVGRRGIVGLVGSLLAVLVLPQIGGLLYFRQHNDTRLGIYRATGEWLRTHTPADARVGSLEVGIIGFYSERSMVDFAGLLQPGTALQLGPTTGYEDAALWAVAEFRPTHLVLQRDVFPRLEQDARKRACTLRTSLQDVLNPNPLDIYECPR